MSTYTHTIDAEGKRIGRVASEAASYLLGKRTPAFARNVVVDIEVIIKNAGKLSLTERALTDHTYIRYSGYPGGQKKESRGALLSRLGIETVLRKTVQGMLPANQLRTSRMKRLTINT